MPGSQFHCPACGALLKLVTRPAEGKPLRCPRCSTVFAAPGPEAEQQARPSGAGPAEVAAEPAVAVRSPSGIVEAIQPGPVLPPARASEKAHADAGISEPLFAGPAVRSGKRKGGRVLVSLVILFVALALGAGIGSAVVFWPWRTPEPSAAGGEARGPAVPPPPNPAPVGRAPGVFDRWLQDPERARRQAAAEGKDVLLLFDGSDWCPFCVQLTDKVLSRPEFRERLGRAFVFVYLDFPQQAQARALVQNPARNAELLAQYAPDGYPTVLLTDAQGRVYAALYGYNQEPAGAYADSLLKLQDQRVRRDKLLTAVDRAQGMARLDRAREALAFLDGRGLLRYYGPLVAEWAKLAAEADPGNEKGYVEPFFQAVWLEEVARLDPTRPQDSAQPVARLDAWKTQYRFKDRDLAGKLHLVAGNLLVAAGQYDKALAYIKAGLAYRPADPRVAQGLTLLEARLTYAGTGTGFVVAPGGYVVTNYHVVGGPGAVVVRVPGANDLAPAEVVAQDPRRDLAVLRVQGPAADRLKPLRLSGNQALRRGEKVAAFGFPLGDLVGTGLKVTTGVVSALPESGTDGLLVLDARINPGNSGGPLCNSAGDVVGMVAAKSFAAGAVESYGMAVTAGELDGFLRKHVRGLQPAAGGGKSLTWEEVDRVVSPSVVKVFKKR